MAFNIAELLLSNYFDLKLEQPAILRFIKLITVKSYDTNTHR